MLHRRSKAGQLEHGGDRDALRHSKAQELARSKAAELADSNAS